MRASLRRLALPLSLVVLAGAPVVRAEHARAAAPPAPPGKTAAVQKPMYQLPRAGSQVVVDGHLDEEVWKSALRLELPWEVHPGDNLSAGTRTVALLAYDDGHLYAAFEADDPDPNGIRARFTDRDTAFQDDFVGLVLDTFNDERRAFEFFVNPKGVQMDLVVDDVSGNEDSSWDAIWSSAGSLTERGYAIEMSIPYTSLRFQRAEGSQAWGLDLIRIFPRDRRYLFALNQRDRDVSCYLCQIGKLVGFEGATPGKNLEVSPTLTMTRTDTLRDPDHPYDGLAGGPNKGDLGLTARWGITPNLVASAAVNPDFSQVEADAAQLAVNEQFALYFPEKRPFFLEGADFFDTPYRIVYTRTVADPVWGVKLTGKEGRNALGAYAAADQITNLLLPGRGNELSGGTSLDSQASLGILRYRRDIGKASTVGMLMTGRGGRDDYFNGVLGADALIRPAPSETLRIQALGSESRYPSSIASDFGQPEGAFAGSAFLVNYNHSTKNWFVYARYNDLSPDFRADLGFVPNVGVRVPVTGVERIWVGDPNTWYSRLTVGGDYDQTTDASGDLIEREWEGWTYFNGPKQTFVFVGGGGRLRGWRDNLFHQTFANVEFEIVPTAAFQGGLSTGMSQRVDLAFDDPADPTASRQGDEVRVAPFVRWEPGHHVRLTANHELRRLNGDDGYLYRANLSELRLTYQMNLRIFFRAILQYEDVAFNQSLYPACGDGDPNTVCPSKTRGLFSQMLFSYKINPQTALYAGYTDAKDSFLDPENPVFDDSGLLRSSRTFFFKVGRAFVM